jgi:hypothetical protein
MSLDTFANFKAAIADKLARSDLTSQIVDCITLFEAEASYELFRMRGTETTTTLTPTSGSVSLPADYLGWRRLTWTGTTRVELEYVHPSILQAYYATAPTDTPRMFTIEGTTLKIRPVDGTSLEFDYFAKTPALSSSLNWLFTNKVDCYWAGTLEQVYLYVEDTDNAVVWATKKQGIYETIKKQRFREDGGLTIRVMGATP